ISLEEKVKLMREHLTGKTNGGLETGNLHKIIDEDELITMLDQGWTIVKELSNSKIVVKREI
ncbi:MAG: site-specific integrase, partial [Nitrososphaeria archaeon]|nr:site-specific integrase [Nitrososphaeria archaeon]